MSATPSTRTRLDGTGVYFGNDGVVGGVVADYVCVRGAADGAVYVGSGVDGATPARVRNVQDAHLPTDAATWGQVVNMGTSAVEGAVRQVAFKAPCAASSQEVLVVASSAELESSGTGPGSVNLTLVIAMPGVIGEMWSFGGRLFSSNDADEGARVLVRHGVQVGLEAVDLSFNGIYYFAEGHGLGSLGSLTLTRASDMDTMSSVRGATTVVLGGTDAGKVFVVTEPEDFASDFALGYGDVVWTAHTDNTIDQAVRRVTSKRPCDTSTHAALQATSATSTTLTFAGSVMDAGGGTWTLGGHVLTGSDAAYGARILVRHGVAVGEGGTVFSKYNGVYYFAEGHGFSESTATPFTLTRSTDMTVAQDVSGATVRVLFGDDAGRVFMVTDPVQGRSFSFGAEAIVWTAADAAKEAQETAAHAAIVTEATAAAVAASLAATTTAITAKRPCATSTHAALQVTSATTTTLTFAGSVMNEGGGTWTLGGHVLTGTDAAYGARILVRHGVIEGGSVFSKYNGVYYFAAGHGFSTNTAVPFTLTRSTDMAVAQDVSGATVRVLFGTDAGKEFMVTDPAQGQSFTLGSSAIQWTVAPGVATGAGVTVSSSSAAVSLDMASLLAVDAADLEETTTVAVHADGATGTCTLADLAAFSETLSNKTLAQPSITGNVQFDDGAVLQVNNIDVCTLRSGTFAVTGTLTANLVMAVTAAPSDLDLKMQVEPCAGLAAVRQLAGYKWQWRKDASPGTGLIAQWLQQVLPELVVQGPEGLAIMYNGLVGVLVNAINDLDAKLTGQVAGPVTALTGQVTALTGQVTAPTGQVAGPVTAPTGQVKALTDQVTALAGQVTALMDQVTALTARLDAATSLGPGPQRTP